MKSSFILSIILSASCLPSMAQTTKITNGLSTGETVEQPKKQLRKISSTEVMHTSYQRVGDCDVTLQEIEEPDLVEREKAANSTVEESSLERPQIIQESQQIEPTRFILMTATVYGKGSQKRTCFRLQYNGKTSESWSNIDGNLLSNLSSFVANGRKYMLIMGNSNAMDSNGNLEGLDAAAEKGCPLRHRVFRSSRANFVMTEIEEGDADSRQIIGDLHKLYRVEKPKLTEAFAARSKRSRIKQPSLPERPDDVTIRFWKRNLEGSTK